MEYLQQIIDGQGEWIELHLPNSTEWTNTISWLNQKRREGLIEHEGVFYFLQTEITIRVRATPKLLRS